MHRLNPLPWLCPLPSRPLVHAAEHGKLDKPLTSTSTTQQQPKHLCVINTVFILSPKHSTGPAAVKKINSVPAKTMTLPKRSLSKWPFAFSQDSYDFIQYLTHWGTKCFQ